MHWSLRIFVEKKIEISLFTFGFRVQNRETQSKILLKEPCDIKLTSTLIQSQL